MCIEFIICSSIFKHCDHSVGDFSWSYYLLLFDMMILEDKRCHVKILVLFAASVGHDFER